MGDREIQTPTWAAQPGLGVHPPPRRCCGAHKAALGLVWSTSTSLPLQLLFGAPCKAWQHALGPSCLSFPPTLALRWRSQLPRGDAVLSLAQGQRQRV